MDDLKTTLDRIRKPLAFASRDNFAHLKSLAAMEPFMRAQVDELKRVSDDAPTMTELEKLFVGFDSLPPDEKKERIVAASSLIDSLEPGRPGPSVHSASPKILPHPLKEALPHQRRAGPRPAAAGAKGVA